MATATATATNSGPPISSGGLLDEHGAAEYLGLKTGTLCVWRSTRRYNLPFIKVGRNVRYRVRDLEAFLSSRTVGAESK